MEKPISSTLPLNPGVYMYKNNAGRIIYVGKARILRKRILSYFRADGLPVKTSAMLRHAVSLETFSTTTEKEALLLEASLIKKHRPHYNIVLRDDKQYILYKISWKHPFPRLEIVRKTERNAREKTRYYGPFTSALAARETWKILHHAFPLRRCSDKAMRNRVRACLYHFMGQCQAPCMGNISPHDYAENVRKVQDLLSGRSAELMQRLETEMLKASDNLEFEKAAALRDQIQAVRRTVEKQVVVIPGGKDIDVIGLSLVKNGMALGILFIRAGVLMDGRNFFWPSLDFDDTPELLLSFLAQFYGQIPPPSTIIVPWIPKIHVEDSAAADNSQENDFMFKALEQNLSDIRQGNVRIVAPRSHEENALVDMAATNAKEEGLRHKDISIQERIASALHLNSPAERIECVDVSHTQGHQTRVGMVVFEGAKPLTSAYRQYRMADGSSDDYATLAAWVLRRLESGPPWPDLLLIDGGKGQLSAVARALREQGQENLFALAAIAKARDEDGHADRRAGNVSDRIFLPNRSNPLPLRAGSAELLFLQHIRDTTHRYAIGKHRKARTNAALSSELMRIPGVGPHTARLLWEHFPSTEAMGKATVDELANIKGIGKKKAASLWQKLQQTFACRA